MNLRKYWPLALAALLALPILYAHLYDEDAAPGDAIPQGEAIEASMNSVSTKIGEKTAIPSFLPQLEAVCALDRDNRALLSELMEIHEKQVREKQDSWLNFENEIVDTVAKIVFSGKLAQLEYDGEEAGKEDEVIEGTVEKGDTISSILEKSARGSVGHYISAAKKRFSVQAFKEGQPYIVHIEPESGRVRRFEYEINNSSKLVVEGDEKPEARVEDIEYVTLLDTAEGVIGENLFKAVADIGESPQLALRLVKLFGSEINFIKHLKSGDSFSVLIEKRYRKGEYKGYGRILAATFTNRGKTYEAYLFRDGRGKETYYNARGENLNKTLLQTPLSFTRMTSRFSQSRFHPILRRARPHLGVDYGAPTGTPVKAVGDGVVTERGWAGGYGNQVVIKHGAGLESLYSHLSGFARGIREGAKVEQGQVIGFVGSTGLSTGPHLDFRLRQNGQFINPVKAINPRGAPVAQPNMAAFQKTRELARACLSGERVIENYTVDSIVPLTVVYASEEQVQEEAAKEPSKRRIKAKKSVQIRKSAIYKKTDSRQPKKRRRSK